jgi:phosphohistidine phosphatase
MKYLYLIRHAKASSEYSLIPDFDRPLKTKGILQAHQMSNKLISKGVRADAILSSTASRTLQTAHIFALKNNIPYEKIVLDFSIYESNTAQIIEAIAKVNDESNHLFVFGHNPSLLHTANYLIDSYITELPVAGVICIRIESDTWKVLDQNKNHIEFFDIPDKIEERIVESPIIKIETLNSNEDAPKI